MFSERPGTSTDTQSGPKDLTGRSIKEKRVRMVHSTDSSLEGTSLYFQEKDPWLAYQRGKDLVQRVFRKRDGVFGQAGSFFAKLTTDKMTPKVERDHASSCAVCHNNPYGDAGAGITIPKNGGQGRNTPHFFGGGLVEMIGAQTRLKVFGLCDPDHRGFIPKDRVPTREVRIIPAHGEPAIDYGRCGDNDGNGAPDLNKIFRIWYVDEHGKRVFDDQNGDGVVDLRDASVAGYNFEMVVFGWGDITGAMTATLRTFYAEPADTHAGMQADDPTTNEGDGSGLARVSNPGAQQYALHASLDRGLRRTPLGISLDDPDGDGSLSEITEGDLDMAEWYMLNAPSPAVGEQTRQVIRGKSLFKQWKCGGCHTPDWRLESGDPDNTDPYLRFDGDRRFFDLQVRFNSKKGRLEGKLIPLYRKQGDRILPKRGAYTIRGIYSDFKHHDLGPAFHEMQFDGTTIRAFRTAPLWGVGSTPPYGHDGRSLALDDVIRRHGGEAAASEKAYRLAKASDRQALIAFLNSLVLYQTDTLPTDMDGDGVIQDHRIVAGKDTGVERFNVEFLFNHPCEIEGPVTAPDGERVVSYACLNVPEAYQEDLHFIRDRDNDGFPDVSDPCPVLTGYLDGCRSVLPPASPFYPDKVAFTPPVLPLGGPEGGTVNIITFDPQDPGTIYAGLDGGGLFKSTDGGDHWHPVNTGLKFRDIMAIAINPATPSTLYVGTGGGIYKSTDAGQRWVEANEGTDKPVIYALAVHPRSPDILYTATSDGIYKSTDGALHWEKLHEGLPHHAHAHGMILDAGNATIPSLDQRSEDIIYAAMMGAGVYRSTDGGKTWSAVNDGFKSLDIRTLAQDPQVTSKIYAGSESTGLYESIDAGLHWKQTESVLANVPVHSILVDPLHSKTLFSAVAGKGVYRSNDGGNDWKLLSISRNPDPVCLAVHPWMPSSLFLGTHLEGIYRSMDGGEHWTINNSGLTHVEISAFLIDPKTPQIFYMGTVRGLFISRDSGTHWEAVPLEGGTPPILTIIQDPASLKVYVGTEGMGSFSTDDQGKSWKRESPGPPRAISVNFISRNPKLDYIGSFGGLFRRNSHDIAWSTIGDKRFNYPQVLSVSVDPNDPYHIYVGAERGVYESKDGGNRWKRLENGIGNLRIRGLALDPRDPRKLYAATEKGLYESTDGGEHWTHPEQSPGGIVYNLLLNPTDPDNLFAGSTSGFFVTNDGGEHWTRLNFDAIFIPLVVDPSGDHLYGTDGSGLIALALSPLEKSSDKSSY